MTNIIEARVILTPQEARRKMRLDLVIRGSLKKGQRHFLRAGRALMKFRDERLFKDECPSFEAYVASHYGFSERHGYRLIEAAQTDQDIRSAGATSLPSERISRALTDGLSDPLERSNAVLIAQEAASLIIPSGQVTKALMEEAVDVVIGMRETKGLVDLGDGQMRNATGALIIRHNERVQAAIDRTNEKRAAKAAANNGGSSGGGFHVDDDVIALRSSCRVIGVQGARGVILEFADTEVFAAFKKAWLTGQAGLVATVRKAKP